MMFNNLKSGWEIGLFIYKFAIRHAQLIIFPLLSALCMASAIWLLFHVLTFDSQTTVILALVTCYFSTLFFAIFFNVSTIFTVNQYLSHNDASIVEGLKFSFRKLPSILAWTAISGTIGLLLKIVTSIEERFLRFPIFSTILDLAWEITSYFVVPVICFKSDANPFALLNESKNIVKEIWNRKGHITKIAGAGIINVIFIIVIYLLSTAFGGHSQIIDAICIFLIGLLVSLMFLADTTLKTIYYRYLTENQIPKDLDPALLESRITIK